MAAALWSTTRGGAAVAATAAAAAATAAATAAAAPAAAAWATAHLPAALPSSTTPAGVRLQSSGTMSSLARAGGGTAPLRLPTTAPPAFAAAAATTTPGAAPAAVPPQLYAFVDAMGLGGAPPTHGGGGSSSEAEDGIALLSVRRDADAVIRAVMIRRLGGGGSAERAALLGDKLLALFVTKELLASRPHASEAELTVAVAQVVSNATLADIAVGWGGVPRGWASEHELGTIAEALLATRADTYGLDAARAVVRTWMALARGGAGTRDDTDMSDDARASLPSPPSSPPPALQTLAQLYAAARIRPPPDMKVREVAAAAVAAASAGAEPLDGAAVALAAGAPAHQRMLFQAYYEPGAAPPEFAHCATGPLAASRAVARAAFARQLLAALPVDIPN